MANTVRTIDFLPEIFKTSTNSQFLRSTLDQLSSPENLVNVEGYIGSKFGYGVKTTDSYVAEISSERDNYQLEPAVVLLNSANKKVKDFISYPEIINTLKNAGSSAENHNKIFKGDFHTIDPFIDLDKLLNFTQYYWLPNGPELVSASSTSLVNLLTDVIGKPSFTSENKVTLSTGMKVVFTGNISPVSMRDVPYYVEGVGDSIKLVQADTLIASETFGTSDYLPFDSRVYDTTGYDSLFGAFAEPEYITINRASKDLNGWSRSNRWFHSDVINKSAQYNSSPSILDIAKVYRAQRPIIEFYPDLTLFNSGEIGAKQVDFIDFTTTNAASINNEFTVILPGADFKLFGGARIIFAADPSKFNKVITINAGPGEPLQLGAEEELVTGSMFPVLRGSKLEGKSVVFNGTTYTEIQTKSYVNQLPLFDILDHEGASFSNTTKYPQTSFIGSTLFRYTAGSGSDDPVLHFPISYVSVGDLGDISFDVSYNSDSFTYLDDYVRTRKINSGFVHQIDSDQMKLNGWVKGTESGVQYQVFNFENVSTNITCDVPVSTAYSIQSTQVYADNRRLTLSEYTFEVVDGKTNFRINVNVGTFFKKITIMMISDVTSSTGYYELPINLTNNPLNETTSVLSLGNLRNHFQTIFKSNPAIVGDPFGENNYRDSGKVMNYGSRIIRHENSVVLPALMLHNSSPDINDALQFSANEYIKMKTELAYLAETGQYTSTDLASVVLDDIIEQIVQSRGLDQPFYWTDMLPNRLPFKTKSFKSQGATSFPMSKIYTMATASYEGLLVYVKHKVEGVDREKLLVLGIDYTLSTQNPEVKIIYPLDNQDTVVIKEFNQTYGSFVPATPTKLGFYPASVPKIILDKEYVNSAYMMQGHDGSLTALYGEYIQGELTDIRDRVMFEFETRIFNNLKVKFQFSDLLSDIMPGHFRTTANEADEYLKLYSTNFLNWVGQNRIDFRNQYFSIDDAKTWNYRDSATKLSNSLLKQGHWRGVYTWFFDTATPHTHPWELLGLVEKPTWWETKYGIFPYPANSQMWSDLESGLNWNNGNPTYVKNRKRPGLSTILPVDDLGNLLFPADSVISAYDELSFSKSWQPGDMSPAEYSYSKSSSFPFDLMKIIAATQPVKFFNLFVDLDYYKYDNQLDQWLSTAGPLRLSEITFYGNGESKHSYMNWLVELQKRLGSDAVSTLTNILANVDVRLVYRVAGFTDSDLMKFYLEHRSPTGSSSSLLVPEESLSIVLHQNEPEYRIDYSAVILQKTENGFKVWGHAQNKAYFTVRKAIANGEYDSIVYQNSRVRVPKRYATQTETISYGTEFFTISQVSSFLRSYGKYLQDSGMIFENVYNGIEINWDQMIVEFLAWTQTGWEVGSVLNVNPSASKLNINKDNLIVSPLTISDKNFILNHNAYPIEINDLFITRQSTDFIVEPKSTDDTISFLTCDLHSIEHGIVFDNQTVFGDIIFDPARGLRQSRLLVKGSKSAEWNGTVDAQGFILNQDNVEEWKPNTKYVRGSIVQSKASYWIANTVILPSSVFDENQWAKTDYQLIQKGMLPNASAKSSESVNFYDTLRTNLIGDGDLLSYSLIGYRPRSYLESANLTELTQFNVFKSMLKTKGTLAGASLFKNKNLAQGEIDYTIAENWAIKNSDFGGVRSGNFVDVLLKKDQLTGNPSVLKFTTGHNSQVGHQTVPMYELQNYGYVLNNENFLPTLPETTSSALPNAGYVNINDVDVFAYNFDRLGFATNKNDVSYPVNSLYKNQYIWLADHKGSWQVFTPTQLTTNAKNNFQESILLNRCVNNLDDTASLVFSSAHGLVKNDLIVVLQFNSLVDGYYKVKSVTNNSVVIELSLPPKTLLIESTGLVAKLESRRIKEDETIDSVNISGFEFTQSKIWVDEGRSGTWETYKNNIAYKMTKSSSTNSVVRNDNVLIVPTAGFLIADTDTGKVRWTVPSSTSLTQINELSNGYSFGTSMCLSPNTIAISKPFGSSQIDRFVELYKLAISTGVSELNSTQRITAPTGVTEWGKSIALSKDSMWLFVTSGTSSVYVYSKDPVDVVSDSGYAVSDTINLTDEITVISDARSTFNAGQTVKILAEIEDEEVEYQFYDIIHVSYDSALNKTYIIFSKKTTNKILSGTTIELVNPNYKLSNILQLPATINPTELQLSTNFDGSVLVIGSRNTDNSGVEKVGTSLVYQRLVETIETQFNQSNNPYPQFNLSSTPEDIISVMLNEETLKYEDDYFRIGQTLVIKKAIHAGDLINISTNEFMLAQVILPDNNSSIVRTGTQFGTSLALSESGVELLIGSPFDRSINEFEGAVYRFTNSGKSTGTITASSVFVPSMVPYTVYINGFVATIPAGNIQTVVTALNSADITNVRARADGEFLTIYLVDKNIAKAGNKLSVFSLNSSALSNLGFNVFSKTQVITPLTNSKRTGFGSKISMNEFNSFVVSAPFGDNDVFTSVDFTDDSELTNDTVFDNNFTQFIDSKIGHGSVYLFDLVAPSDLNLESSGKYLFSQYVNDLTPDRYTNASFGGSISFSNGSIVIAQTGLGVAENSKIFLFTSESHRPNWQVISQPLKPVDLTKINSVQLFDTKDKSIVANLDYFNPLQGKLLGVCHNNLDFISSSDPAVYNIYSGVSWSEQQLGKTWLDTSGMKFINTHQSDVGYNSKYWGRLFPGSSVTVYTWVKSNVQPVEYDGPGTPLSFDKFSAINYVDSSGLLLTHYYYWVRATNTITKGKTLSDSSIEYYIIDPAATNIPYASLLGSGCVGLHNVRDLISETTVLHLGFSEGIYVDSAHTEYTLIQTNGINNFLPGLPSTIIPNSKPSGLYKKMIHSLTGIDDLGQTVPDPLLPKDKQFGTGYRPRQSMFVNRFKALQNYLTFFNQWLLTFPYIETGLLSYLSLSGPNFDVTKYWEYVDWYADGFSKDVKITSDVEYYYELANIDAREGTVVTVSTIQDKTETYVYSNKQWSRVGLQNGTIQFKSNIWDTQTYPLGFDTSILDSYGYDRLNNVEIEYIIRAINEEITLTFPEKRNAGLVILFNYAQSETAGQKDHLHWLVKTSLVDIYHTVRELAPTSKYSTEDQEFLFGYVNEIKPYHVVIKDYILKFTKTENIFMTATDYDLPAQYSETWQEYITPELTSGQGDDYLLYGTDSEIWDDPEYASWFSVYGMSLDEVTETRFAGVLLTYIDKNSYQVYLTNTDSIPKEGTLTVGNDTIVYKVEDTITGLVSIFARSESNALYIPNTKYFVETPNIYAVHDNIVYSEAPSVTIHLDSSYPAPREEMKIRAKLSGNTIEGFEVLNRGSGYLGTPTVFIGAARESLILSTNLTVDTISWVNHGLQTGSKVRIVSSSTDKTNNFFYVRVLSVSTLALYHTLKDATNDSNRIKTDFITTFTSPRIQVASQAFINMSPKPVRTFKIKSKYDRTTYRTKISPWTPGTFYAGNVDPVLFGGLASESDRLSRSLVFSQLSAIGGTGYGAKFIVSIPKLGMTYHQGDGTISSSITSAVILGVGTDFTKLQQGQELVVTNGMNIGIISSIQSSTELTLQTNSSINMTNESFIFAQAYYEVVIESAGVNYVAGDVLTIPGSVLNNGSSANDLVMTVDSVSSSGSINFVLFKGVPNLDITNITKASSAKTVESLLAIQQIGTGQNTRLKLNYTKTLLSPGHLAGKLLQVNSAPKYFRNITITSVRDDVVGTGAVFDVMSPVYKPESVRPHYLLKTVSGGTRYRRYDVLTIDGSLVGGVSGVNDINITVTNVGAYGEILNFYVVGKANVTVKNYYVKPVSSTDVELYKDHTMLNPVATSEFNFSVGDNIYVPYPLVIEPSLVKFNGYLYVCLDSNNDADFNFTKWKLLKPESDLLNAIDRAAAYGDSQVLSMTGIDFDYTSNIGIPDSGTITVSTDHTFDDIFIWQSYELEQPENLGEDETFFITQDTASIQKSWDLVVTAGTSLYPSNLEAFIDDIELDFSGVSFPHTRIRDSIFSADDALDSITDSEYTESSLSESITSPEFSYGYGPAELVPGLMLDSVSIIVRSNDLIDPSLDPSNYLLEKEFTLTSPIYGIENIDITNLPAIVETSVPHSFIDNELVIMSGITGSVQLNTNIFLVRVVDDTKVALYYPNLDEDALDYDPVEGDHVASYIDNGVIFKNNLLNIEDILFNPLASLITTVGSVVVTSSIFNSSVVLNQPFSVGTVINVVVNNAVVIKESSSYRIEIDRKNDMSIYRVHPSAVSTTTSNFSTLDDKLYVADASKFADGRIALINGEKIFYSTVNTSGNYLSGLIRGVETTGIQNLHASGSVIETVKSENMLPRSQYNRSWNTMIENVFGEPLQNSNTPNANFLT